MKKIIFLLLIAALTAITASAEPANPTPVNVTQPDGTTLQLRLVGDEFYHFNTPSMATPSSTLTVHGSMR